MLIDTSINQGVNGLIPLPESSQGECQSIGLSDALFMYVALSLFEVCIIRLTVSNKSQGSRCNIKL